MVGNTSGDIGEVNLRVAHDRARVVGDSPENGAVGTALAVDLPNR